MTENIYKDEQEKKDIEEADVMAAMFQIVDVLDRYNLEMVAVVEDGLPAIDIRRAS